MPSLPICVSVVNGGKLWMLFERPDKQPISKTLTEQLLTLNTALVEVDDRHSPRSFTIRPYGITWHKMWATVSFIIRETYQLELDEAAQILMSKEAADLIIYETASPNTFKFQLTVWQAPKALQDLLGKLQTVAKPHGIQVSHNQGELTFSLTTSGVFCVEWLPGLVTAVKSNLPGVEVVEFRAVCETELIDIADKMAATRATIAMAFGRRGQLVEFSLGDEARAAHAQIAELYGNN